MGTYITKFFKICALSKIWASPVNGITHQRATIAFQTIYNYLKGQFKVASHGGYKYLISFIDDYSRYTYVYFLESKNQAFQTFKHFYEKEILYEICALKYSELTMELNTKIPISKVTLSNINSFHVLRQHTLLNLMELLNVLIEF